LAASPAATARVDPPTGCSPQPSRQPVGRGPGRPAGSLSVKTPAIGGAVTRNHVPPPEGIPSGGSRRRGLCAWRRETQPPERLGDAIKPAFHGVGAL